MTVNEWNWIGMYGFAIGAAIIFFMWSRRTKAEEEHSILHFFVPIIAMASYFSMACHEGQVTLHDGTVFYYGRYIDWMITTPMLLFGLSLTALRRNLRRPGIVGALLAADAYMIATGLFAGLSVGYTKWVWYTFSCVAFLGVYGAMWGPLRKEAEANGPDVAQEYKSNAMLLSVIWFFYPVVFLIGSSGVKSISPTLTAGCFTCLDLTAKVLYGILSLSRSKSLTTKEIAERKLHEQELISPANVSAGTGF